MYSAATLVTYTFSIFYIDDRVMFGYYYAFSVLASWNFNMLGCVQNDQRGMLDSSSHQLSSPNAFTSSHPQMKKHAGTGELNELPKVFYEKASEPLLVTGGM